MDYQRAIKELRRYQNSLYAIHYSCQSLCDSNEGYFPRITSIAVLHIELASMHSFSIHLVAEENHICREDINEKYDVLEKEMLSRFYQFVQDNSDARWLHWKMSNINYGFETLAHRYRVLAGVDAPRIEDTRRYDLSKMIESKYGEDYVDDPKMPNLMDLNGGRHRDFLLGGEEVQAFIEKDFIKLHKSTMIKVYWFQKMYYKFLSGKVITQRSNWPEKINKIIESIPVKILGFISVLYAVVQLLYIIINQLVFNVR